MTSLASPHYVVPGACACNVETRTCVCAPADLDAQLAALNDARARGDSAEIKRLAAIVRTALSPAPMPPTTPTPAIEPPSAEAQARRRYIEMLTTAWITTNG